MISLERRKLITSLVLTYEYHVSTKVNYYYLQNEIITSKIIESLQEETKELLDRLLACKIYLINQPLTKT